VSGLTLAVASIVPFTTAHPVAKTASARRAFSAKLSPPSIVTPFFFVPILSEFRSPTRAWHCDANTSSRRTGRDFLYGNRKALKRSTPDVHHEKNRSSNHLTL